MEKITFNTLIVYNTIYHIYKLLYCKGHIGIITSDSTINVNKTKKLHSIHITFISQYITLTSYYSVKNTLR